MRAVVVAAAEVVTAAADAATKLDRLETKHAVRAGARREGALRPSSFTRQRGRSSKPHADAPAAMNVLPVSVTLGDRIEALRQWHSGWCLSTDRVGVYSRERDRAGGRLRRVVVEPRGNRAASPSSSRPSRSRR